MFAAKKEYLKDYNFIYTDGSKTDNTTTFSITTENRILRMSILPSFSSVYSAELIAIYEALSYVKDKYGKFAICSDSLSSLQSVLNIFNNSFYVSKIRNVLVNKFPNIILIWIPGHYGIMGNEFADSAAKSALNLPLILKPNYNHRDINKMIDNSYLILHKNHIYNLCSTWYRRINNTQNPINISITNDQQKINRLDRVKFERLRLGHTRLTHGTLINPNLPHFCNCDIVYPTNPSHFLCECPKTQISRIATLQNIDPLHLLSNPSMENVTLLIKFLKISKLYNEI